MGDGEVMFRHVCKLGLDGIVGKDKTRAYRSGRVKHRVMVKNPAAPGVLRFEDRDGRA